MKTKLTIIMIFFMVLPEIASAQKFQSPERIQNLCEQTYNSRQPTKDCTCFTEKYKAKEMDIFKKRGSGTVTPYDAIFRLIDHECHIHSAHAKNALGQCLQKPPVAGLTTTQIDIYCKCQSKALSESDIMFQYIPNATADMKKQARNDIMMGAKRSCKEQALRTYQGY